MNGPGDSHPEGIASFKCLLTSVKLGFNQILTEIGSTERLRLPGRYRAHQIEGDPRLWTLKERVYRGIFRWDGSELRFIRFGHRDRVYFYLPK